MIRILACGKVRDGWLRSGIEEYARRIRPYEKLEIEEVADEKAPETNSDAENRQVIAAEGERLLKKIRPQDYVILLDLAGKPLDSVGLAEYLDDLKTHGHSQIDFVIGGSLGVSPDLIRRADFRWKLSDNTFPHQLCRLLVLEQIYRACRIQSHEPYHK